MKDKELISSVQAKSVPSLQISAKQADLGLQELEIVRSLRNCASLEDVDALIDKLLVYIGLNKCLEV